MNKKEKERLIKKHSPRSPILKNTFLAFFFGGLISLIGRLLLNLFFTLSIDEKSALTLVCISLIGIAAILTGLGVFDNIARHAGAGTLVPVTGFSNSTTSAAMDSKEEGLVLGLGAKIFTVAGPVILYGLLSGSLYGLIYYSYKIFFG